MEIPGYRDFEEIGRGSASVVYRAYQEQFARTVAVKVLSVGTVEERLRRRFERECAATGRLTGHPNIVTVLDNGYTAEGSPYVTTAYYAHGSLGDRLKKQGTLPLDEVLKIGVKVAGALEAVHRSEILHRDIKPSNLLESGYGEPALTGFGIAAIDPSQQQMTMAQSFAPVHTPPEVVLGKQATEATDTYQLASTLYALLAGHAPFETGTDDGIFQMLSRIQEDEVPPIDRPDVPMAVIDVLRVAMAKKPEDRYPSSAAFGERLQALQQELGMVPTDLVAAVDPGQAPEQARPMAEQTIMLSNVAELTANANAATAAAAAAAAAANEPSPLPPPAAIPTPPAAAAAPPAPPAPTAPAAPPAPAAPAVPPAPPAPPMPAATAPTPPAPPAPPAPPGPPAPPVPPPPMPPAPPAPPAPPGPPPPPAPPAPAMPAAPAPPPPPMPAAAPPPMPAAPAPPPPGPAPAPPAPMPAAPPPTAPMAPAPPMPAPAPAPAMAPAPQPMAVPHYEGQPIGAPPSPAAKGGSTKVVVIIAILVILVAVAIALFLILGRAK